MAIARYMMWLWAKRRKSEERDRQAQEAQEEEDRAQQQRQAQTTRDVEMLRSKDSLGLDDSKRDTRWFPSPDPLPGGYRPPPQDQGELPGTVVTTRICVVVLAVRISGLGTEAGQPVRLTIKRREVSVIPTERETPGDLARRAEECLGEEMKDTVAAAGAKKAADLILLAQGPTAAAEVADLKSDLHRIMLGQLVPPLAQYVPLPGIDRSLDTAEVAILVGGIVLGTVTANPALYSVCVKSLAHKAIAEAIKAALSDYARPLPPVRVIPEGPVTVILNSPPPDKPDVSLDDPEDVSPDNPGMRTL